MSNNQEVRHEAAPNVVKVYIKPAIAHELKLETRAGSPLLVDPLSLDELQSQ